MKKRGVSPVIATMLLVGIVVFSVLIVFVWIRGFTQETITKFGGENIELTCEKVNFDASYTGVTNKVLSITNVGNVPIKDFDLKVTSIGSHTTHRLSHLSNVWPVFGLRQGQSFSGSVTIDTSSGDEILLVPILIGQTSGGEEKIHICKEHHGYKISL